MVATFLHQRDESLAPPSVETLAPPPAEALDHPLFIVFGGRVADPGGTDFTDLRALDIRGIFASYDEAYKVWRGANQMHVDEALTKYVIARLR